MSKVDATEDSNIAKDGSNYLRFSSSFGLHSDDHSCQGLTCYKLINGCRSFCTFTLDLLIRLVGAWIAKQCKHSQDNWGRKITESFR